MAKEFVLTTTSISAVKDESRVLPPTGDGWHPVSISADPGSGSRVFVLWERDGPVEKIGIEGYLVKDE